MRHFHKLMLITTLVLGASCASQQHPYRVIASEDGKCSQAQVDANHYFDDYEACKGY